jgi:hypothetical protein
MVMTNQNNMDKYKMLNGVSIPILENPNLITFRCAECGKTKDSEELPNGWWSFGVSFAKTYRFNGMYCNECSHKKKKEINDSGDFPFVIK